MSAPYHPDYPEDQAHADVGASRYISIRVSRQALADGEPPELTIVAQGQWLAANFEPIALAEHLTIALARLAEEPTEGAR